MGQTPKLDPSKRLQDGGSTAVLLGRDQCHIEQPEELTRLFSDVLRDVQRSLRVDRVSLYRFELDGSSQVVAESLTEDTLPSLLGLYFPVEEVSLGDREALLAGCDCIITDRLKGIRVTRIHPMTQHTGTDFGGHSGTSRKTHVEAHRETNGSHDRSNLANAANAANPTLDLITNRYQTLKLDDSMTLLAMGITLVVVWPIHHGGQLWGRIVADHRTSSAWPNESALGLVRAKLTQIEQAIDQSRGLEQSRSRVRTERSIALLCSLLYSPEPAAVIYQAVLEEVTKLTGSDGGRLHLPSITTSQAPDLYCTGLQPDPLSSSDTSFEQSAAWHGAICHRLCYWSDCNGSATTQTTTQPGTGNQGCMHQVSSPSVLLGLPDASLMAALLLDAQNHLGPRPPNLYPESWVGPVVLGANQERLTYGGGESQRLNLILHTHDLLREPSLESLWPAFINTPIRGVMMVPLRYQNHCFGCLSLFRQRQMTGPLGSESALPWTGDDLTLAKRTGMNLYWSIRQHRIQDLLHYQAFHDRLTGLANRFLFEEQLSLALARTQETTNLLAVIFVDLDGFKTINDTLGHAAGDRLLQQVAARLKMILRSGEVLARWGGDEFTLLLPRLDWREQAIETAEWILATLQTPILLRDRELFVKASLGIAIAPYDGNDAETLLKHADAALYRAKRQGRACYEVYAPGLGMAVSLRLLLENDLHRAIDHDQLELHYQPQMALASGQMVGFEALLRWQHPTHGWISPEEFVRIAEENGLIHDLGQWVLDRACRDAVRWQTTGRRPLPFAVNLSALQLQRSDFVKRVAHSLAAAKLDPKYLDIEIVETVALEQPERAIAVFENLRALGTKISLDDFGMGYSSLWALKHLPLDKLKIDRSFILDGLQNPRNTSIVRTTIDLAQQLGLWVVAEGVETIEQVEFLRSLRCDAIQGYWYSRPLPFDDLLANWPP